MRYDRQGGKNLASTAAANPVFPTLLPAVHYAGQDAGFTWTDVTPRLGLTYALGAERKTLLRASYSRFADQLGTGTAGFLNPLARPRLPLLPDHQQRRSPAWSPATSAREIAAAERQRQPLHPRSRCSPTRSNPDLKRSDHRRVAARRRARPAARFRGRPQPHLPQDPRHPRRRAARLRHRRPVSPRPSSARSAARTGAATTSRRDPVSVTAPDGHTYTVHYWELRPGRDHPQRLPAAPTATASRSSRAPRSPSTSGSPTAGCCAATSPGRTGPGEIPASENEDPTDTVAGGVVDGTEVLQGSGTASGPKGNVFINSKWSYSLNGMYQIAPDRPWGFNVAANLTGRQGYPLRYVTRDHPRRRSATTAASASTSRSTPRRTPSATPTSTSSTCGPRRSSPSATSA